jgi:hypothetical protein
VFFHHSTEVTQPLKTTNREWVSQFWKATQDGIRRRRGYQLLLDRWLDRQRIASEGTYFEVASSLLVNSIIAIIVDEDDFARKLLDTAEFYLQRAIETDNLGNYQLGNYQRTGQIELGRAERLRELVLVRWIRDRRLRLGDFRTACALREKWNHEVFSSSEWHESGFRLSQWMGDEIVLGDFQRAKHIADKYYWGQLLPKSSSQDEVVAERVLTTVADTLLDPTDPAVRRRAEAEIDAFYSSFTNWGPNFAENEIPYDQKLVYAHIRGHFFKGVEDPVQLIKMMKFSD